MQPKSLPEAAGCEGNSCRRLPDANKTLEPQLCTAHTVQHLVQHHSKSPPIHRLCVGLTVDHLPSETTTWSNGPRQSKTSTTRPLVGHTRAQNDWHVRHCSAHDYLCQCTEMHCMICHFTTGCCEHHEHIWDVKLACYSRAGLLQKPCCKQRQKHPKCQDNA